jgi:hypothetical protein
MEIGLAGVSKILMRIYPIKQHYIPHLPYIYEDNSFLRGVCVCQIKQVYSSLLP